MARDSSGNMTLVAGNPVVTGTTVDSSDFNDTMDDFKDEITDSLSRSGKGGMTAPLRTADGSVSAPAHSFTSETNTGLFRAGSADLRLSLAGALKVKFVAAGLEVHHSSADDPQILLADNSANALSRILHTGSSQGLDINQLEHGLNVRLRSEDAAGTLRTLLEGDPDGTVDLYYDAVKSFSTDDKGINVYSTDDDDPVISLYQDDLSTRNAILKAIGGGNALFLNEVVSGNVILQGTDAGSSVQNLMSGDPDGISSLFYAGTAKFRTADETAADKGAGAEVLDGAGNYFPVGVGSPVSVISSGLSLRLANAGFRFSVATSSIAIDIDTTTNNCVDGTEWSVTNHSGGTMTITTSGPSISRFTGSSIATWDRDWETKTSIR